MDNDLTSSEHDSILLTHPYTVVINVDNWSGWDWCFDNIRVDTWKITYNPFWTGPNTYYFTNSEDATLFKLKFGVCL
jgi:hypothetical protein